MRRLYFRTRGHRFQLTLEKTLVMNKMVWVLEQAGRHSMGPGLHTVRHCRTNTPDADGLGELLEVATTERIW